MTEALIALGATSLLLLVFACAIAKNFASVWADYQALREKNDILRTSSIELRKTNDDLRQTVYDLTAENNELRNCDDSAQRIAELKFQIVQKQEKIDELQTRLKEYRMLLKQKWEGSRHG
jgi:cell division protein FtsB